VDMLRAERGKSRADLLSLGKENGRTKLAVLRQADRLIAETIELSCGVRQITWGKGTPKPNGNLTISTNWGRTQRTKKSNIKRSVYLTGENYKTTRGTRNRP